MYKKNDSVIIDAPRCKIKSGSGIIQQVYNGGFCDVEHIATGCMLLLLPVEMISESEHAKNISKRILN